MAKERLDQILVRMGFVTRAEVKRAVEHLQKHGCRLGSALLYLGLVSEAELVHALCEQHQVSGFFLDEQRIYMTAIKKLPAQTARKYEVLPFAFHRASKTVSVAAVDPGDRKMISAIKKAYRAKAVEIYVASESMLRLLIDHYYRGSKANRKRKPNGTGNKTQNNKQSATFGGSLEALSFIDILQVLAQATRSVRVALSGPEGEKADVYLRKGRLVHAESGDAKGVDAIYHIIGWGGEGSFNVEPAEQFPEDNIFEPNEAVLMEGCRLLDEAVYNLV